MHHGIKKPLPRDSITNPESTKELLREYHEGIIALSACLAGEIPRAFQEDDYEKAKAVALEHLEILVKEIIIWKFKIKDLKWSPL